MRVTTALSPRTWGVNEPWWDIVVDVTFRKRDHGLGYYVVRTDTNQVLGMVSKADDGWRAYTLNGAYYSADEDTVLVPKHDSHRAESTVHGEHVGTEDTRANAVHDIIHRLLDRWAMSLEDLVDAARADWLAEGKATA